MSDLIKSIKTIESVLDAAIWLEKKGQAFYENALLSVQDEELKSMIRFLIEQERKHEVLYKTLFNQTTGKAIDSEELFGEYGLFVQHLVSEITASLEIPDSPSVSELLHVAIRFEKDTLLYFHEIRKLFPEEAARSIQSICDEERNHIRLLMDARRTLQLSE